MGILSCLRTRRQRHLLPRGHTISQPLALYHDDPREKSQPDLSSPNQWLQPTTTTTTRPASSCSWASHLTSPSCSPLASPSPSTPSSNPTTTTTININARLQIASCLNQLDQLFGRHHVPGQSSPPCPTRRPPSPSPQTSDNAPCAPPLYTALSSSADLALPSYADLPNLNLGAALSLISPCLTPRPREPPPSFEAAEIQEHEDLHGSDPFRWPGCEYCRGYALWFCYWREDGEMGRWGDGEMGRWGDEGGGTLRRGVSR
ncbi:hypothetical protein QBC32DRAFT_379094 [Pseudoneurospora amorphoporcata]|uniref:Uncharacterized protein n=1 Tax=Pseudoneurospora amorphoporcata TaxID=241081 RepID=A0AAN6NNV6_9PEZI|nr:hypothetical protein QBC32DRAFT_379094 [Pseudoneurospora amorphoporcata]